MAAPNFVTASLNYLKQGAKPPEMVWRKPRPGEVFNEPEWESHQVCIHDMRGHEPEFSLENDGFAVAVIDSDVDPDDSKAELEAGYFPAVIDIVRKASGARDVIAFDYNFRRAGIGYDTVADEPAMNVHNDYTENSARQRIRDLLPAAKASRALAGRFAFINLWRPIRHPALDLPLAVMAPSSLAVGDLVTCAMRWPDRNGEIYVLTYNPNHVWFYLSAMKPNEALLLKCFDSAGARARFAPHTAFVNPASPAGVKPRESVEVRTIALFD